VANSAAAQAVRAGSPLAELLDKARGVPPEQRTALLTESDALRSTHAQTASQGQTAAPAPESDVDLHFVAFVRGPSGKLLELDGRRSGPVVRDAEVPGDADLLKAAVRFAQSHYMAADPDQVNFNLIALGPAA